jgi:hypothetical protein
LNRHLVPSSRGLNTSRYSIIPYAKSISRSLALGKVAPHQGEAALFELLPPGGTCRLVRADQAARVGREQQRQEYLYLIGNMENL